MSVDHSLQTVVTAKPTTVLCSRHRHPEASKNAKITFAALPASNVTLRTIRPNSTQEMNKKCAAKHPSLRTFLLSALWPRFGACGAVLLRSSHPKPHYLTNRVLFGKISHRTHRLTEVPVVAVLPEITRFEVQAPRVVRIRRRGPVVAARASVVEA